MKLVMASRAFLSIVMTSCLMTQGFAQAAAPPQAALSSTNKVLLKAGTELRLRFAQRVDSKTAVVGDPVEMRLDEDLLVDGQLVAKKDMRILARVVEGKKSEKKRQSAKQLAIALDNIMLGGQPVLITGTMREKAKTDPGSVIAGGIMFGLTGILAVLAARHVTIQEGTVIPVYVAEDAEVEVLPPAQIDAVPRPEEPSV